LLQSRQSFASITFLSPIGTFTIAEPRNWVALFTFLATSLIASQLSARAKQQALEAMERREETERLYALSRAILLTEAGRRAPKAYTKEIAQIFELSSVALFERDTSVIYSSGPSDLPNAERKAARGCFSWSPFVMRLPEPPSPPFIWGPPHRKPGHRRPPALRQRPASHRKSCRYRVGESTGRGSGEPS